jgi:hypothetical protein
MLVVVVESGLHFSPHSSFQDSEFFHAPGMTGMKLYDSHALIRISEWYESDFRILFIVKKNNMHRQFCPVCIIVRLEDGLSAYLKPTGEGYHNTQRKGYR